ncbi:MAG: ribonuclease P protein component [Alphaproteobacteria bacterium]|nr:ribonuclease P protein component [Alphaproteobacteria bacterium]
MVVSTKEVRLTKRAEFVALTKNRKAISTPHFTLQYMIKQGQEGSRFGYTASKKVGNAVVRNRVKRRLREIVRLYLQKNNDVISSFFYDFVLIGRASAQNANFDDLTLHFRDAMDRVRAMPVATGSKVPTPPLSNNHV